MTPERNTEGLADLREWVGQQQAKIADDRAPEGLRPDHAALVNAAFEKTRVLLAGLAGTLDERLGEQSQQQQ